MPTSPRGSRSCGGRNPLCGVRTRSAASSRSTASMMRPAMPPAPKPDRSGFAGPMLPERSRRATASLSGAVGWQRSTGIDSFGAPGGDKDGYRNLSGRLRGTVAPAPDVRIGAAAFALYRSHPVRRLRPAHLRAHRYAGQYPQPARGGSRLGRVRRHGSAWSGTGRRVATRLVEPQLPRERAAQSHERIAAHDRCPARASLRNRPGPTPTDPCRRSRKREIPCSRPQLRPVDGPGPKPRRTRRSPPSGLANARALPATSRSAVTFSIASRTRRPCVPLRKPSSAAASPWPDPTPRAWPSRPSSTCTGHSRIISWVIQILSRKPRADSKGRFVFADPPSMPRSPPIGSGFTTKSSTSSILRHSCPPPQQHRRQPSFGDRGRDWLAAVLSLESRCELRVPACDAAGYRLRPAGQGTPPPEA